MVYKVYGKPNCMQCNYAKALLEEKGIEYEYIDVSTNSDMRDLIIGKGFRSVPVIEVEGKFIEYFELKERLIHGITRP